MIRSTVEAAVVVCSVPNTRWPVSAVSIAIAIVSRSRISPTSTISGSSRSAARSAALNPSVCTPTCRWVMMHFLFSCTNSIGSSIVMMWSERVRLIRSTSEHSVVDLPTGSGKSTTLCSLVDLINRTRSDHIITIEDPIEFVHENKKCIVTQRQVGVHTDTFRSALRAALREDPDILLVGEMRDLETVAIAIETAETGHLVFGTLHTTTAASTVDRIIDQFPGDRQSQIRVMLSESLKGVIAQTLCKRLQGGRVAAREILLATPAVANLVREGKTFQLPSIIQTSKQLGMLTMNDSLLDLVDRKEISADEAYVKSVEKVGLAAALKARGHKLTFTA